MDQYLTGAMIKRLRERKQMTQAELAEKLCISDKTISKWETGKGYPDISLIEQIADILEISVIELFSGSDVKNSNPSGNMLRTKFYVCPICGNVIHSLGTVTVSCHGITLPPLEYSEERIAPDHQLNIEKSEDEFFVSLNHPMSKQHYISFIAALSDNGIEFVKLFPEGHAAARFKISRTKYFIFYCNHHGLFKVKAPRLPRHSANLNFLKHNIHEK